MPWRRGWQSTPVFLPGEVHGQRSLVGYIQGVTKSQTGWGHEGGPIMMASLLLEEEEETWDLLTLRETQRVGERERRPCENITRKRAQTCWHPDLRLPSFKTERNKCLLLKPPRLWHLATSARTQTPRHGTSPQLARACSTSLPCSCDSWLDSVASPCTFHAW